MVAQMLAAGWDWHALEDAIDIERCEPELFRGIAKVHNEQQIQVRWRAMC